MAITINRGSTSVCLTIYELLKHLSLWKDENSKRFQEKLSKKNPKVSRSFTWQSHGGMET